MGGRPRARERPISTPAEYSKRGKQAARAGNYDQAGDFYRLAGDWKRANEMYLKGGHYDLAARLAEEMGDLPNAALFYLKSGQLSAAGEIELKQDNREKAAWMFNKAGQYARAAELLEGLDQFAAAAENYRKGGFRDKAAILYVKAGKEALAASIFEELIEELTRQEPGGYRSEAERSMLLKYHRYCGELHMKTDRPEKAAPHFELALMNDQAAEAWRRAGHTEKAADILLRLQRPEEAFKILQAAGRDISSLGPGVQAEILARQGNQRGAAEVLEKAGSLYKAAEMWKEAGEPLRAAVLFEKEGETDQAANLYVRAGKHDEAARMFESARDYKNAADLYRKAGRTEDAARVYMKADDPIAAARLYYDAKNYDACIKALQKVPSDDPGFRKASFLLGRIFAEQELHTLAADKFAAAIDGDEVNDETVIIYYSLALAHEANLRPREALSAYQKIVSFDYAYKDALKRMKALEEEPLVRLSTRGTPRKATPESGWAEPNRYRVEQSIGAGKLGEVFSGVDTALGRKVAIRRVHEGPNEAGKADRFLKEAAQAAQLSHPNIVSIYDTGADENGRFIVSALADGKTLRALLNEKVRFEMNRVVEIGRQILQALEHAHSRGVLHRNLRPENIFVTDDDRVSIADFGLGVRLTDLSTQELSTGRLIQYTPPEMLLKDRVDARSDLYSLGIILYEMAVGHPPFEGSDVGHQQANAPVPLPGPGERTLPDFLKAVILKLMEKEKDRRYPDATTVLRDLQLKEVVPGITVSGRYEVLAEIGRGGMGTIFRARDTELDEMVALKFLAGEIGADLAARFVQEIKSARKVNHPNVVRVFTLEKWQEHRFIVMEYIDGVPLTRWLARTPAPARADRQRLALQLVSALDAAHKNGIVHRDIKPENILVSATGDAKVLDFGIARPETPGHTLTATGAVVGSPMYMSPEQIQAQGIDRRTDIYSLGAVLYYLFTGIEPFAGKDIHEILMKHLGARPKPPHEIDRSLPRPLSDAILRALAPDREKRFQAASDLTTALSLAAESAA
ncbi:MAG TPA: protein kinase [Candidatus Polarisedimenticolia bacterium]|nr:protein kinase [Candidatus Polarisedimenticolia bacterium]